MVDGWSAIVRAKQETRDVVAGGAAGGICRFFMGNSRCVNLSQTSISGSSEVDTINSYVGFVKVPVDTRVPVLFCYRGWLKDADHCLRCKFNRTDAFG